ncbi:hypothetical protein BC332_24116 [Capsicum chinense]|nr:hypothetical protein BC332_24116 [Capsicum chinense]
MHIGWTYLMRTLKWDPMFNPEEETTTAIAWISFPVLPPNFFRKEVVFSLGIVEGNTLQVDMVIRNQTRPSCARVKQEVDFLRLERIEGQEDQSGENLRSKEVITNSLTTNKKVLKDIPDLEEPMTDNIQILKDNQENEDME